MYEIDIGSIAESKMHFMLNPTLWESFDSSILRIISIPQNWSEVKLLSSDGEKNPQLSTLPNDKGGIYLFLVKSNILPESCLYLMYVGRAHASLRERCSRYPTEKRRPKIKRMIEQWGPYLYIRYLPLEDIETIDSAERELINKILPPCNDEIPDKKIRNAIKAFSM
jgi:hypothetical protein